MGVVSECTLSQLANADCDVVGSLKRYLFQVPNNLLDSGARYSFIEQLRNVLKLVFRKNETKDNDNTRVLDPST